MAVNKISDLLPISDNNVKPHAYEVFGLSVGESNPDVIRRSVEELIAKVKASKSQTEPALWKQIAGIVQTARVTLLDPKKKTRLDAQLGRGSPQATKPADSKPVDPLATLLPPVNPMQLVPSVPPVMPEQSPPSTPQVESPNHSGDLPVAANPIPPGLFSTPAVDKQVTAPTRIAEPAAAPITPVQIPEPPTAVELPNAQPIIRDNPRRPIRRKKSVIVPVFISMVILALIALVGLLAYALFIRQESIAISSSDGSVKIAARKDDPAQRRTRRPVANHPRASSRVPEHLQATEQSRFPMGSEPQFGSVSNSTVNQWETDDLEPMVAEPAPTVSPPTSPTQAPMETQTQEPMQPSANEVPVASPTEPEPMVETKLTELRSAIRKANWLGMSSIAESINQMQLGPEQQTDADGLLSVADLATYYRTGIEQAVAKLDAGNDFEVTNGFRVVVVGKTSQSLTVRYNTKIKEFKFDELPFSLAHRLATFQVPKSPSGDAAKAVYQAIAPLATPGHRSQAITWLSEIDQPIEGADRDTLVQTLQSIFDDN